MADVLCVGAHPDDVELGMGATVASMVAQGLEVVIVDLTDGEPTPRGTHETRMVEAARAAAVLGAERVTLEMPNRYLFDSVEARTTLAGVIREHRPGIVFAPYPVDAHPDHIAAASIAEGARFYAKFTKTDMPGEPHYPAKLLHYVAVHLRLHVEPSFVLDASGNLDAKVRALRCYESQFAASSAGVLEWVSRQAAYWGSLIGKEAGEPFYSREPVGLASVTALL